MKRTKASVSQLFVANEEIQHVCWLLCHRQRTFPPCSFQYWNFATRRNKPAPGDELESAASRPLNQSSHLLWGWSPFVICSGRFCETYSCFTCSKGAAIPSQEITTKVFKVLVHPKLPQNTFVLVSEDNVGFICPGFEISLEHFCWRGSP